MRKERILSAYEYLRSKGFIHTQSDLAEKMQSNKVNVSKAMAGNERYLTDKFLKRLNNAFGRVFNEDWLLEGKGEMLKEVPINIGIQAQPTDNTAVFLQLLKDKDTKIAELSEQIGMLKQQVRTLQKELGKSASNAQNGNSANAE